MTTDDPTGNAIYAGLHAVYMDLCAAERALEMGQHRTVGRDLYAVRCRVEALLDPARLVGGSDDH